MGFRQGGRGKSKKNKQAHSIYGKMTKGVRTRRPKDKDGNKMYVINWTDCNTELTMYKGHHGAPTREGSRKVKEVINKLSSNGYDGRVWSSMLEKGVYGVC